MDLNIIQLVVVNISSNMLHTIGLRAFFNLNQLQTVNLSNNLLHTLAPDLFEYNQRLKQLILAGNKYVLSQQLSNTFLESNSLQVLDMSKCFISHLYPNIFLQLPNLTALDISNNLLIELKASVIENLTKLKHLKLSKNLWICNNKMAELKLYLNHKHIIYENPCETLEKSQKIVLLDDENQEDGDEGTVNWLYNDANIDRPNEDIHRTNQTKYTSTTINKTFLDSTLLLIMIAFSVGFVFGIFVTCFSVNILSITKRVKRNRPKPELSEFILNDIPYGMSTPVLNRVQRYT